MTYDVRGPLLTVADGIEAAGGEVLRLNLGNMRPFGFAADPVIVDAVSRSLAEAEAYSDSRGLPAAREAVARHYRGVGVADARAEHVYLGNGVSELIGLAMQALVDPGDEILVPAPDYPTWTAAVNLAGGVPVHYLGDESDGWNPSLADIESKVTERTRALVLINPNNPTGAVYDAATVDGMIEIARRHDLVVLSDEIYDRLVFDGGEHRHAALAAADDVLCLTLGGLSKAFRVCGFRSGWLIATGATGRAADFLEGLTLLANVRVCPNVPGQYAVAAALDREAEGHVLAADPDGRIERQLSGTAAMLDRLPGVTCVRPRGALYCFPRLDPEVYPIGSDSEFVLDLLRATHVLVTPGTGFNWPHPDHFRIVCLPEEERMAEAIGRIGEFLAGRARG